MVFGGREQLQAKLDRWGWKINTAFPDLFGGGKDEYHLAQYLVARGLTGLAEGLCLPGTARLCRVGIERVALGLELAALHCAEWVEYLSRNVEINQVQLDDLAVRLRAASSKPKGQGRW